MISILRKLPRIAKSESGNGIRSLSSSNAGKTSSPAELTRVGTYQFIPPVKQLRLESFLEAWDGHRRGMEIENKNIIASCQPKDITKLSIEKIEQLKKAFKQREVEWIRVLGQALYLLMEEDLEKTTVKHKLSWMLNEVSSNNYEEEIIQRGNFFHFAVEIRSLSLFSFLVDYYKSYSDIASLKAKLTKKIDGYGTPLDMLVNTLYESDDSEYIKKCLELVNSYTNPDSELNIVGADGDHLRESVEHCKQMNTPVSEMITELIKECETTY